MDYYLTNPNIEGVYETKVPSEFKIITDIGSTCRIVDWNDSKMDMENLTKIDSVFDYKII